MRRLRPLSIIVCTALATAAVALLSALVLQSYGDAAPGTATSPALPAPAPAGALVIPLTVEELTAEADRVAVARVVALASRLSPAGTSIETDVTIAVESTLKGSTSQQLVVTVPGGQVGELRQWEGGVPNFLAGERVLLFLLESPTFGVGLAELWQGKYSLVGDQAVQPETGERTPLSEIEHRIASALGSPVSITPSDETVMEAPFVTWTDCTWSCSPGYYVNPTNPVPGNGGPSGDSFKTLVHQSHQAWEDLPDSFIDWRYLGETGRSGADALNDRNNDVRYADLDAYGTNVLGVNTCVSSGGYRVDSDTRVDSTRSPTLWDPDGSNGIDSDKVSLQSVLEHELGHALGLLHTNVTCDDTSATPLMCSAIAVGQRKTILADDQAGAASLYPAAMPPCPAPVGGIAEAADADALPLGATASGGSSGTTYAVIAGIAAGAVLLAAGGWYARRRRRAG